MSTTIISLRSFPEIIPEGRPYVMDDMDRLYMDNYDYAPKLSPMIFASKPWDGLLIVEWDIAISRRGYTSLLSFCLSNPDFVIAADYELNEFGYACRDTLEPIRTRKFGGKCNYFGLGCTYIPRDILTHYLLDKESWQPHDRRMTDTNFSRWHLEKYGQTVIAPVRVVHLNGG